MVIDYFIAEIQKLIKRPACWVLGAILVIGLVLLSYFFTYIFIVSVQQGDAPSGTNPDQILQGLLPERMLVSVLDLLSGLGGAIALVLGALVAGSEYGWGTLKLMLSQRPGKLNMLFGQIFAIGAVLAAVSIVMILLGALCSALVAALQDRSMDWPSLWEITKGFGAGWLILAAWASMGVFLATLFKGSSLAIGLGLAYTLIIEALTLNLPIGGDTFERIQSAFLGKNAQDLAGAFGNLQQGPSPGGTVDPSQAVYVILAYIIAFSLISALLFRRRDV